MVIVQTPDKNLQITTSGEDARYGTAMVDINTIANTTHIFYNN